MKKTLIAHFPTAALLGLLLTIPLSATSVLYTDGPIGEISAWGLEPSFLGPVADSFTLGSDSTLTSVNFGAWIQPGGVPTSVDWSIVDVQSGAITDTFASGTANIATNALVTTGALYDIYSDTFPLPSVSLPAGSYFLALENAQSSNGSQVFWDENDGPATAWTQQFGYLTSSNVASGCGAVSGYCSESFTISGTPAAVSGVPEPSSLAFSAGAFLMLLLRAAWVSRNTRVSLVK